jgi:hypothetical protein
MRIMNIRLYKEFPAHLVWLLAPIQQPVATSLVSSLK